jgi:peptidoglycan hydrolase-like protein with peptidoglycan-binding domain
MTQVSAARSASATSRTAAASFPTLREGAKGASVVSLQNFLRNKGYKVTADGDFGPKTLAAVKGFQKSRGLAADGIVGPKTWTALRAAAPTAPKPPPSSGATPTLRAGAKGASVEKLQTLLRGKGYGVSVDGDFGPRTLSAVKSFQQSRGLAADGVVGPNTWKALNSAGGVSQPGPSGGGKQVTAYVQGRPSTITVYPVGNGKYLQADAARNFKSMQAAARSAGVNLSVNSGFRSNAEQKVLYQKYLNGTGNLAAKPGYSNHQSGISVDIGGVNGYGTKAFKWLQANAGRYGFVNDVRGEFWHWTYRGPRS